MSQMRYVLPGNIRWTPDGTVKVLDFGLAKVAQSRLASEPGFSNSLIFTVLGAVAELERNLIKERVHMGISRARKQGKQLGRPKRIFDKEKALLLAKTTSIRQAARQQGVSRGVVERVLSQTEF